MNSANDKKKKAYTNLQIYAIGCWKVESHAQAETPSAVHQ